MTFPQRLLIFIIGILLGSLLVSHLMRQRREAAAQHRIEETMLAPVGTEAIQRAAVPGIAAAYNRHRKPMHDAKHVASAIVTTEDAPEGLRSRFILLRGKGDAHQVLGIREWIREDADLVWGDVLDVRIFAADRILVRVKPGTTREQLATALEPLGMAIVRGIAHDTDPADPSAPLRVTVDGDTGSEAAAKRAKAVTTAQQDYEPTPQNNPTANANHHGNVDSDKSAHHATPIQREHAANAANTNAANTNAAKDKREQAANATRRGKTGRTKGVRLETPPDVVDTDLFLVGFTPEAADSALKARAVLRQLPQIESAEFDFLDIGHRYTQSPSK